MLGSWLLVVVVVAVFEWLWGCALLFAPPRLRYAVICAVIVFFTQVILVASSCARCSTTTGCQQSFETSATV